MYTAYGNTDIDVQHCTQDKDIITSDTDNTVGTVGVGVYTELCPLHKKI